jgi:hypothetical protein
VNGGWRFAVSDLVIEFLFRARADERRRAISLITRLTEDPYLRPTTSVQDRSGREISLLRAQNLELAYLLDHFVKEVRMIEIRKFRVS